MAMRHARTFLRFPLLALSGGSSSSARPPGPMLLLRVLRAAFFGDAEEALEGAFATSPSAIFSLPSVWAMVVVLRRRVGRVDATPDATLEVNNKRRVRVASTVLAPDSQRRACVSEGQGRCKSSAGQQTIG
jgi:hypothetical protein